MLGFKLTSIYMIFLHTHSNLLPMQRELVCWHSVCANLFGVLPHSQSPNQLCISHPVSVFDKRVETSNIIQCSHIIFYEKEWAVKEMQLLFHLRDRLQHELATCLIADNVFIKETLLTISLANLQISIIHTYQSQAVMSEWIKIS